MGDSLDQSIYGYEEILVEALKEAELKISAKEIYHKLLFSFCRQGTSLIPTRIERRLQGVRWTRTFKNIRKLPAVTSKEKQFVFLLSQDILPVRGRIHRKNADKRCLRPIQNGYCDLIQDRIHFFISCTAISNTFRMFKELVIHFLDKNYSDLEILHLSFSVQNKKATRVAVWFVVKFLFFVFEENMTEFGSILGKIKNDVEYSRCLGIKLYLSREMDLLEEIIDLALQ